MSTTTDLKVAIKFTQLEQSANPNRSGSALLFRVLVSNMMQRGADLAFLSAFPDEAELLYPPLTYLKLNDDKDPVVMSSAGAPAEPSNVRPRIVTRKPSIEWRLSVPDVSVRIGEVAPTEPRGR